jgi:hypothetical protein
MPSGPRRLARHQDRAALAADDPLSDYRYTYKRLDNDLGFFLGVLDDSAGLKCCCRSPARIGVRSMG